MEVRRAATSRSEPGGAPAPTAHSPRRENTIRISFTWVLLGAVGMVLLGMVGGSLSQQLFRPPLPPLTPGTNQLISTVQEVTISPNTAVADMLGRAQRSVLYLARQEGERVVLLGIGTVITNDGVVVSSIDTTASQLVAYDAQGRRLPLSRIGEDTLYGLTYFRMSDNVVVPLDLEQHDAAVGQELVALALQPETFQPRVASYRVAEYILPPPVTPSGVQKLMRSRSLTDASFAGSPLLSDAGNVAAIFANTPEGGAIPVSQLSASLTRINANQRELTPLTDFGVTVTYAFHQSAPDTALQFMPRVTAVRTGSLAAAAGLAIDDYLVRVEDEPITWEKSLAALLTRQPPFTVTVLRGSTESVLRVTALPTVTPRP